MLVSQWIAATGLWHVNNSNSIQSIFFDQTNPHALGLESNTNTKQKK